MIRTLLIASLLTVATEARADFYAEVGIGLSQVVGGSTFFTGGASDSTGLGMGLNFLLAESLVNIGTLDIQLGIKGLSTSGSDGGLTHTIAGIYPMLRFELASLYFGAGITPFVFKRSSVESLGIDYNRNPDETGMMLEVGMIWRMVPFFSLSLELNIQTVINNSFKPFPAWAAGINFRFLLAQEGGNLTGGGTKRNYDGWRYPFGIRL